MADINTLISQFSSFKSTFKDTSFDDSNGVHLCTDETQSVINYDKLIEHKYPDSNERPKSFDALYVHNELIFCIEFKNQKPAQISNSEVQEKIVDGKNELVNLLQALNIQKNNYKFVYCVAYKECKEPYDRYKCGVTKEKVQFGLETYVQNGFVEKVYTQNVSFFTKQFKHQLQKELAC